MANNTKPKMVSDGKRMRLLWQPEDGDGESALHLIERSLSTLKGHPTWKLYIGDIKLPIDRDSADAPPRYVYLDDKACYTIWASEAYEPHELKEFWPFDFNANGLIRSGRMNRGRPAWKDEAVKTYQQAPVRGKNKFYEFSGEFEVTDYAPVRPSKYQSKMAKKVADEWADKDSNDTAAITTTEASTAAGPHRSPAVKVGKSVQRLFKSHTSQAPNEGGVEFPTFADPFPGDQDETLYPRRANLDPSKHMQWQTPRRALPESSIQLGIKPLPLTGRPVVGPTFHSTSTAVPMLAPPTTTEPIQVTNSKRKISETHAMDDQPQFTTPEKRPRGLPFVMSSSGSDDGGRSSPPSKRKYTS